MNDGNVFAGGVGLAVQGGQKPFEELEDFIV
jgi:hypothetical protein